ncbi:MAG: hypothetical protein LUG85_01385 [Clostridiales bacterium]|nr:hypothetical protein [Clostridiales bacterium]MCD7827178.1 hypothetical protein [Clostridiales bacterium]
MKDYFDRVHRWGVLWDIGALLMLLGIPTSICLYLGVWPELEVLGSVLVRLMVLYWITAVIEVFTYVPMLGAGGTYLSFVTGNITNLKLPAGLAAMENAGVRANTEEGEVISTIAIGVSSITTTVIIAVGVLAFSPLLPYITDEESVFQPAFQWVLPALFGALGASYFAKHWKLVFAPVIVGVIVLIFSPTMGVGTLMFITIIASCGAALLMYKMKLI